MDFRILRIEPESKKIGLSHRAAKHDEPVVDVKSYTTEVGGGMASLGELADFFNRPRGTSLGETDKAVVDVKSYTTEAGGGMASLGELADFFNKRSSDSSEGGNKK